MAEEKTKQMNKDLGSFRDPASQVYVKPQKVAREIRKSYYPEYDQLMKSGLYQELVDKGYLIPHRQCYRGDDYLVILPDLVPFITYPYEWSFAQLQEAAFVTLETNRIAMNYGMMLKDASAYNIQMVDNRMCLIDTCSFMVYHPGMPWGSYPQFLRNFLSPMVLIKWDNPYTALKLLQTHIDGIPVPMAASRMPLSTRFSGGMWAHIFSQSLKFAVDPKRSVKMNKVVLTSLLNNLYSFVSTMKYKPIAGEFLKYSELGSYSQESLTSKLKQVNRMIQLCPGKSYLDLGSNTGVYSKMAAQYGNNVIAIDANHDCIHSLYYSQGVLPLVVDICQPSPGIGWANTERKSFWDRVGKVDCIMALAILHHLCLKNNVPLDMVADLLKDHTQHLIIEWVPPDDPKAQQIMGTKKVPVYDELTFLDAFDRWFRVVETAKIQGSMRVLYYMERKDTW